MRFVSIPFVALAVAPLAPAAAQNAVNHYDGTTEFTSRGVAGVAAKILLQRLPNDQIAGRTAIDSLVYVIQDQAVASPEAYTIEVRTNDPFGAPTGSPDLGPGGLVAAVGPIAIAFPPPGPIVAVIVTMVFAAPIALPPTFGVPAGDIYVGLSFPPSPAWPADGISLHISGGLGVIGEQMLLAGVGYSGVAGVAALGWDCPVGGPAALGTGNRAWRLRTRLVDDVVQPFADNPAVFTAVGGTGANPNFGYAGIWPDGARGDTLGWRAFATGAPGDLAVLLMGPPLVPPVPVPPMGTLCVMPSVILGPVFYGVAPAEPPTTVVATFGPFPFGPGFGGVDLHVQVGNVKAGGMVVNLSTGCRSNL